MSNEAGPNTPAALARLVLSDRARDVVDGALRLVPTLDDGQRPPGDLLLEALRVRAQVDKLVTAAVLNAREPDTPRTTLADPRSTSRSRGSSAAYR
ncbi:hypothetical protein [Streptomyces pacificus]|uniref:Uncharacterized protein n=1 Tax=Streptomyces pacificus TaxID=2705029 RepID=A0A6A0B2M4_9ACTN|nr:hypothetical protein [Streptomyces pacificus]GFH39560.1 hypothetical protein SCWH03_58280 [Streptomyces pacificus]